MSTCFRPRRRLPEPRSGEQTFAPHERPATSRGDGQVTETLPVDGHSLTLEQFLAVVRGGCGVSLSPEARPAIAEARKSVERAIASGRAVYGVNTGVGSLSDRVIPVAQVRDLQLGLVRSHASGTGPPLPEEVVRGMLLLRANALAAGHSGVRETLIELLLELLNRRVLPRVPEQGSVGASGDLAPLAHIALVLIGEGECIGSKGTTLASLEALRSNGLAPLQLEPKEGVALINGTSLMASYLALAVADVQGLLDAATIGAAMSFDALGGALESLDPRLGEIRALPEQTAIARAALSLLEGSELSVTGRAYSGQDPYTLRCIPQVFAAVQAALAFAGRLAMAELNAVSDNPVVFGGDEFVSGGNFHGETLALALDTLAIAVPYLAAFSERRVSRLLHPALNRGLPPFLATPPGLSSGFMIPQYLAAALVNENATLAHPASVASLPTSADQEDFVSMGPFAGAKLRRIVTNTQRALAIEWIVAAQALEMRRPRSGGRGTEAALRTVRRQVPSLSRDRSLADDIARVASAIADGSLVRAVRAEVPF